MIDVFNTILKRDKIIWLYDKDTTVSLAFDVDETFEVDKKGKVQTWASAQCPPRHQFTRATLKRFYEKHYETHPNQDCQSMCPICLERGINNALILEQNDGTVSALKQHFL